MSREHSLVLRASAGTGKTFRLTNRLLQLYAGGAGTETILASTFTRKAAGEILERLVQRLSAACESDEACAKLAGELAIELDRARVASLATELLRRVDRLRISTLDAWFQERAQRAALELGLPADWDACEPEVERRLAGRALSAAFDRPRKPQDWSTLITNLKRGGAESRVHAGLLASLSKAAHLARECTPDAWDFPALPADVEAAELERAGAEFDRLSVPATRQGTPRKKYQGARDAVARCVREENWIGLAKVTLFARALEPAPQFDSVDVPPEWVACLRVFARRVAHRVARLVRDQNEAMRSLSADFLEELDAAMRRERRLSFDALPRRLAEHPPRREARPDVAHLLLDEFQDTSRLQWRALEAAAASVIDAEQASFFCVGDVKQSIYAWREGNPQLFVQLAERLRLRVERMAKSFRSSPVVLDFVNRIFEVVAESRALGDDAERAAGRSFGQEFDRHETDLVLQGRVRMWCGPKVEGSKLAPREDARIARGVASALELHRAHPEWRIAFLLRKKKLMPRLLEKLGRAGLAASGEGGNPLTDSGAVNVALSLLEFADHPADDFLWFHLASSPLAAHAGIGLDATPEARESAARALRERWLELGPADFFAALEAGVRAHYGEFDRRRFAQLLALVQRLEPADRLRPAQFAERLALERVPDPASARIQVMTVHGAKGLEFEAVILLDLDLPLNQGGERGLIALRRDGDPRAPYDVVTHTLASEAAALLPDLAAVQSAAKAARIQEELCVLYVALTRAIHHLELVVDHPGENLAKLSHAGIVLDALGIDEIQPDSLAWDSDWEAPLDRASPEPAAKPVADLPAPRAGWTLKPGEGALVSRAPSQLEAGTRATAELFRDARAVRSRGNLWHAWLEQIEWGDAGLPGQVELVASAASAGDELARSEARAFLAAIAQPEVRDELSRSAAARRLGADPDALELWRERRFAWLRGSAGARELLQGAIDRAVIAADVGRAEIVDFKTSAVPESERDEAALAERAKAYLPQLRAYREALALQVGLAPERIALRVCFVSAGRTVTLE